MDPDKAYAEERATVATRKSQLPVIQQDKMLAELNESLNVLAERLNVVMTPVEETNMKDPGDRVPEPPKSELQRTLDDHNSQIRKATNKVNSILERLEI